MSEQDYIDKTMAFVTYLEGLVEDVEVREAQLVRNGEKVAGDVAGTKDVLNKMHKELALMRVERDEAVQRVNVADKLAQQARGELDRVQRIWTELDVRERELDETEARIKKDLRFKDTSSQAQGKAQEGLDRLNDALELKDAFIKKQQQLLYDKQKSLEDREGKIMKDEQRLRLYRDRK